MLRPLPGIPPLMPVRWYLFPPDLSGAPNVFPYLIGQKFLVEKALIRNTLVSSAASGRERRISLWTAPRWLFKIEYDVLRTYTRPDELATLYAFFNAQAGELNQWLYWDRTDNQAVNQSIGGGNGSTTTFQLQRFINNNPNAAEPIYAVAGTPTVYVNGGSVSYTLGSNGLVTLASAPPSGAAVTWSGYFYFVCRFDVDEMGPEQNFLGIWALKDLSWRSVKPY
jgi:uncharacterized protein (TIGR02217 family)